MLSQAPGMVRWEKENACSWWAHRVVGGEGGGGHIVKNVCRMYPLNALVCKYQNTQFKTV